MLTEHECRVLRTAVNLFVNDFEPREAASYMEMAGVFKEDEANKIKSLNDRFDRLCEFNRIYVRRADRLDKLIEFFHINLQPHLETFLRDGQEHYNDNPRLMDPKFEMRPEQRRRLLAKGMVPKADKLIKRTKKIDEIKEKIEAQEKESHDSYFVVLSGLAGVGKTALASAVLHNTDLLGTSFEHVCFVTDSRSDASEVNVLFSDILVMIHDAPILSNDVVNLTPTALRHRIANALLDRPNLLVVLDDVTQPETVYWAEQLGLRVLATTRNRCLFNAATANVEFVDVGGFDLGETKELLIREGIEARDGNISANDAVQMAHEAASGNPAVLGKMGKLAGKRPDKLKKLAMKLSKSGVSCLSCISPYRYENVHESLSDSAKQLPNIERSALACAAVMPFNHWIPLDVWGLVVPVDVADTGDILEEIRSLLRALHDNGGWLDELHDGEAFRVPALVSAYLRETVDMKLLKECHIRLESAIASALTPSSVDGSSLSDHHGLARYFRANLMLYGHSVTGTPV